MKKIITAGIITMIILATYAYATSWSINSSTDTCGCSGNIHAGGNMTAQNVFIKSDAYVYSSDTIKMTSAGTWYNITYPPEHDGLYNIDVQSNNYTIVFQDAGRYEIHGFASFNNSNPAVVSDDEVAMRGLLDGVEVPGSYIEKSSLGGALTILTNSIQIDVNAGSTFVHQIVSNSNTCSLSTDGTYTTAPVSATASIKRIR